jgi:hypothetical protein
VSRAVDVERVMMRESSQKEDDWRKNMSSLNNENITKCENDDSETIKKKKSTFSEDVNSIN